MALERWKLRWRISPRWPYLREIEDWERRFEDFLGRPMWRLLVEERGWMPSIDVFEKDDKFVVKAELPGKSKFPTTKSSTLTLRQSYDV